MQCSVVEIFNAEMMRRFTPGLRYVSITGRRIGYRLKSEQ